MYKDFKKSETLDTGFVGGSGIIWMFSGIVLGLLVGIGMYYLSNNGSPSISAVDKVQKTIVNAQSSKANIRTYPSLANNLKTAQQSSKPQKRKEKFSYYAVLPTLDVPVGTAKPIDTTNSAQTLQQSTPLQEQAAVTVDTEEQLQADIVETENVGDYLLQVASFRKKSMANKTRGRLHNKGIDAYIQKKKVKGRFWYRVVAGPVDQNNIDNWKQTAERLGHRPLVISVR